MAYEYINVRMSRSNANINWGFTLRQAGNEIAISSVEKDSMADKAGILLNDVVQQVFGQTGVSMNEAQNRIRNSNEVTMVLKRFVTNLPSLPWSLDEKDSKVFVNHFDTQGRLLGRSDQNTNGYVNSFVSSNGNGGGGGAPLSQNSYNTSNYSKNFNETSTNQPISYGLQPFNNSTALALPQSNTVSSESHSKWDTTEGNVKKHFESSRSYQKTESSSVSPAGGFGNTNWGTTGSNWGQTGGGFSAGGFSADGRGGPKLGSSGSGGFSTDFTSGQRGQSQTNNYQNLNSTSGGGGGGGAYGGGGTQFGIGSGGGGGQYGRESQYDRQPQFDEKRAASMEPTYVQTGGGGQTGSGGGQQKRAQSSTPYNSGPRVYYHHSPRTYREVSPHATIRHLQYNDPIGMYSPESVAEQYKMQTGQDMKIDSDYPGTRPVYMNSATRRAIAEEEQGRRGASPVHQSPCFERISAACGTPVQ